MNQSSFVVVALLDGKLERVATGYHVPSNIRRFVGGDVLRDDSVPGATPDDNAMRCAKRILAMRAGANESDLQLVTQVDVRHPRKQVNPDRSRRRETQHFFCAVAKEGFKPCASGERDGLTDLKFVDVPTVLASWQLSPGERKLVQNSHVWRGGNANRINPYHAMGLARTLLFLRSHIPNESDGVKFHSMLASLADHGINLDTCVEEINTAMLERRV